MKHKIVFISYVYIHAILICFNSDRQINKQIKVIQNMVLLHSPHFEGESGTFIKKVERLFNIFHLHKLGKNQILRKILDKLIIYQFLMCHLVDNAVFRTEYHFSAPSHQCHLVEHQMGILKQGRIILKENQLSSLMNTCFSSLWCFCAHMKISDQSHLK